MFYQELFRAACGLAGTSLLLAAVNSPAQAVATNTAAPRFLGATSCASAMCHGGGGENQDQYLVWSLKDYHSQRPYATLTTARSKQIANALGIADPTTSERCTSCHAPLSSVPENQRGKDFKVSEGVSCESCHGPAEHWLRSHTRPDYTHADRVASGMRDLNNLYVRANTCVACHQNVDADILAAGHPELIFELDGQCVAEPKHWRESANWNGAQAWMVGQAVALREMSWQLAPEQQEAMEHPDDFTNSLADRMHAVSWVLHSAMGASSITNFGLPKFPNDFEYSRNWGDQLARQMAGITWSNQRTEEYLNRLAGLSNAFRDTKIPQRIHARRAERLVLALDRLVEALPEARQNKPLNAALNQLFSDAQSLPDFNPTEFAAHLEAFQKLVPPS